MCCLRWMPAVTVFILVVMVSPGSAKAQEKTAPDRVGRILVLGNSDTPDWMILWQLDLRPGQVLDYGKVEVARKRLTNLGLFDAAQPPSVEVSPNELDDTFKDIHICIKERPWNWLIFTAAETFFGVGTLDAYLLWSAALRVRQKYLERFP